MLAGLLSAVLLWSLAVSAPAAEQRAIAVKQRAEPGVAQRPRLALVIGNGAYPDAPLANPPRDARAIAGVLGRAGFDVILAVDATQRAMDEAIADFGRRLTPNSVGLVFYAGHGIQSQGRNYLIPVDAQLERETDLKYRTVDAGRILDEMGYAGNGLNIVILDACRNNPLTRSFRGARRGLARMGETPTGTLLAYSTAPGQVAADGEEANSPYTAHLVKVMQQPGLPLELVFKGVLGGVSGDTGGRQVPWYSSSVSGDFYFFPPTAAAVAPAPPTRPAAAPPPVSPPSPEPPPAPPGDPVVLAAEWIEQGRPREVLHEQVAITALRITRTGNRRRVEAIRIQTPYRTFGEGKRLDVGDSLDFDYRKRNYRLTLLDIDADHERALIRLHATGEAGQALGGGLETPLPLVSWLQGEKPDFSFNAQVKILPLGIHRNGKRRRVKAILVETPYRTFGEGKRLEVGDSLDFEFSEHSYWLTVLDIDPDRQRVQVRIHDASDTAAAANGMPKGPLPLELWLEGDKPDFSFNDQVKLLPYGIHRNGKRLRIKAIVVQTPHRLFGEGKRMIVGKRLEFDFASHRYALTVLDIEPERNRTRVRIEQR